MAAPMQLSNDQTNQGYNMQNDDKKVGAVRVWLSRLVSRALNKAESPIEVGSIWGFRCDHGNPWADVLIYIREVRGDWVCYSFINNDNGEPMPYKHGIRNEELRESYLPTNAKTEGSAESAVPNPVKSNE